MSKIKKAPEPKEPAELTHVFTPPPPEVASLICQGEVYSGWYIANKQQNRFYVVNLGLVIDELQLDYTKWRKEFEAATLVIDKHTSWVKEFNFNYKCSHTQLGRPNDPKYFSTAAALIVGMDVVARKKGAATDIYSRLRILPAQYFVDLLDASRLAQLEAYFNGLGNDERKEKFGENAVNSNFRALCLTAIKQQNSEGLLDEMAKGDCVTKWVASRLEQYINQRVPEALRIGPVRGSGDFDRRRNDLGTGSVAPSLLVPKTLAPNELGPRIVLE